MNLKIPGAIFLLIAFLKVFKKHTYESENTLFHANNNNNNNNNNNFKGNNPHKNHYTNNPHKNNYTNQ